MRHGSAFSKRSQRPPARAVVRRSHWADPALLTFVERLVDWSRGLPILVLCTGRPELFERHPTWGGGTRNATTVSLSPLSPGETERLLFSLLETAVLPAETTVALLERSGGNPLYTEEYVRLFLEHESAELPMPDTVHGLIAARLDTLTVERMETALDRALELLEPLPPGSELVDIYGRRAALESMKAQSPARALEWAEKAIALAESLGERRGLVRGLMWRGLMRCELGDLAGIEDLERALHDAVELRVVMIPAYVNLADQVWRQRGPAAALEIQEAGITDRISHGAEAPTWLQAEKCWMLYDLGSWDELVEVADGVTRYEEQHGPAQPGGMARPYAVLVNTWRGALDEDMTAAREALI